MAIPLQGDPYNLQGSAPVLQGGQVATVLQPAAFPMPVAPRGPAPVAAPVPAPTPARPVAAQAVAQPTVRDLSGLYGLVGSTVYRKSDNYGFPEASPFLKEIGAKDFNGLKFDTAYKPPATAATPSFTLGDGTYDAQGNKISQQQQGVTPVPTTPPASPAAQNPNQTRIDELSKEIFKVTTPNQQKLYEDAYNAAGLGAVRTQLTELNSKIATIRDAYAKKEAEIGENPWLSEASRIGRVGRLTAQRDAEIANYLDAYQRTAELYNEGVKEINDSVDRQVGDFNNQRQIGTEELSFLLGIREDERADLKDAKSNATDFQEKQNILSPFYKYPNSDTVYDTKTGEALTYEQYQARGGAGKPGAKFPDVQELSADESLNLKDYPSSYQEYLLAKQDGFSGTYTDYQNADANRKARASGGGGSGGLTPGQVNTTVNSIAGAFDNEPIVKAYNTAQEGFQTIKSIGVNTKSPADDIAFIYAFAKIMDPNSVVREGEYNTVQRYAQTWADNFGFKAARIFSNTNFLTADAKQKMLNALQPKITTLTSQYKNLQSEYQRQINDAYAGNPRQITNYGGAFDQPAAGGGNVDLNDLF